MTNPEAHSIPEEILLPETGLKTILHTSNLAEPGQLLMTDAQLDQLREHLSQRSMTTSRGCTTPAPMNQFAMEIEFKITSANILAIKQAQALGLQRRRYGTSPSTRLSSTYRTPRQPRERASSSPCR